MLGSAGGLRPQLDAGAVEDYVDYLISAGRVDEAAEQLAKAVNDDEYGSSPAATERDNLTAFAHAQRACAAAACFNGHRFVSRKSKTNFQLWMELAELCSKNANKITRLKVRPQTPRQHTYEQGAQHSRHAWLACRAVQVEPILRSGISRFTDQVGRLWILLADYYIRLGQFEMVRAPPPAAVMRRERSDGLTPRSAWLPRLRARSGPQHLRGGHGDRHDGARLYADL